jgi:hypothetical protein
MMRSDAATMVFGVRINVWVSILVFIAAVVYFIVARGKGEREDLALLRGDGTPQDGAPITVPDDEDAEKDKDEDARDSADDDSGEEKPADSGKKDDVEASAAKDADEPGAKLEDKQDAKVPAVPRAEEPKADEPEAKKD